MLRIIKLGFILAAFVGLSACGNSYDWMNGEFEGTTKITSIDGTTKLDTVSTGNGRINFKVPLYARLGTNTPLPDCNVHFSFEDEDYKYYLNEIGSEYQGEANGGGGCKGFITKTGATGAATDIEFYGGRMRREKDGEVIMNLEFRVKGATGTGGQYEFEFRGKKKGWF